MQKHYDDPHEDVAQAIITAKEAFYGAVRDAASAGFPVSRIIGIVGFANAQHILGSDAVEAWRIDRGYTPRRPRDLRQHSAVTPMMMPRTRNT